MRRDARHAERRARARADGRRARCRCPPPAVSGCDLQVQEAVLAAAAEEDQPGVADARRSARRPRRRARGCRARSGIAAVPVQPFRGARDDRSGSSPRAARRPAPHRLGSDLSDCHTRHVLAAILTIGNELVSGDTENTNASWLARRLESLGVRVAISAAVPDETDRDRRVRAARARPRVDHLIVTGGLGGTPDDITREALAAAFGVPQEAVPELAADLRARFRGDPEYAARWAALPQGSQPLDEPARRRARLPDREHLGAAGPAERDEGDVRPLRRRAAAATVRSRHGGAGSRRASRRSPPRSSRRPARWPEVTVGSYPSFEDSGPEVEVVLKSADPDALAAAKSWLESGARPADLTGTVGWWPAIQPETYLADLNPAQREAVLTTEGPLLVIAGAGSGKTRVLTYRVAHLLAAVGVKPNEILAITFTNKAAQEMKERVERQLGPIARAIWIMTFHSACGRILRREAERLGYRVELHDLRLGRPGARRQGVPRGARARPEALRAARHPLADLEREEPADRPGRVRVARRELLRPDGRRRLHALPAQAVHLERRRLRRHADADRRRAAALPRSAREVGEGVPLRDGRRVPGHEPRAVRAAAAARRAITRT